MLLGFKRVKFISSRIKQDGAQVGSVVFCFVRFCRTIDVGKILPFTELHYVINKDKDD